MVRSNPAALRIPRINGRGSVFYGADAPAPGKSGDIRPSHAASQDRYGVRRKVRKHDRPRRVFEGSKTPISPRPGARKPDALVGNRDMGYRESHRHPEL